MSKNTKIIYKTISNGGVFEKAQPETIKEEKININSYIFLSINGLSRLRFGCVLVAFPTFFAQQLRSFSNSSKIAQPEAPVAGKAQPLKTLSINKLNLFLGVGCAVAPKNTPTFQN